MTTPILFMLLAASPSLLDTLRGSFDPSLDKMKAKFVCTSEWTDSKAPTGAVSTCKDPDVQLMLEDGKVFSVGRPLLSHAGFDESQAAFKQDIAELERAKCTALRKQGQMVIFDCPKNFAVVLLYNWNSKDDSHSVSALYGTGDKLLASVGLSKKK